MSIKPIEYLLKQHRQQAEIESLDYYLELITKRMRQDYRDSIHKRYPSRPSKIVGLFEHHYEENIDAAIWKELNEQALKCFTTFWESEIYQQIKNCEIDDILEIEDLSHFFIDELKVYVSMDFCLTQDSKVIIYDWKTGKSDKNATSEQLACYALYSNETWGVLPQDVKLIEFNLSRNEKVEHYLDGIDFQKIQEGILESSNQMRSLLIDPDSNIGQEDDFDLIDDPDVCKRCFFKGVCSKFPKEA